MSALYLCLVGTRLSALVVEIHDISVSCCVLLYGVATVWCGVTCCNMFMQLLAASPQA